MFNLRYTVTTSPATLPAAALVGSFIWLLGGLGEGGRWGAWLISLLTMLALIGWNRRATLNRHRPRMTGALFFVLLTAFAFLETWNSSLMAVLCYVFCHIILIHCYQDDKSQGTAYHAFLLLGVSSFFFRPMLLLTPFFLVSLSVQTRALTWRLLCASLLGLATPYWIVAAWGLLHGQWMSDLLWQSGDISFGLLRWSALDNPRRAALLFLLAYIAIALIDYIRTYYQDKIRTRIFVYTVIVQLIGVGLMLFALPRDFDAVMRLLCCVAAPLIGHHLTLVRGRFVNWYFAGTLSLVLFLIFYTRF